MTILIALMSLLLATVLVVALGDRLGLPWPVLLVLLAVGGLFVPQLPDLEVPADLMLPIFLPPLLWALARRTSWGAIRSQLSIIASLSVVLVLLTIAVLTGLSMWLLPAAGVAGSIVLAAALAPPDPVAVDAVAEPVGIPRRITSTLSTEGLFNDAASIVTFHLGIAALIAGEELSLGSGLREFVWAIVPAVVIGLVVGRAAAWFSDHVGDISARNALTWVLPFAVYIAAEHIETSGVIAVVITAIELTSRATLGAEDRLSGGAFWGTVEMLFTGVAFGLIGFSVGTAIEEVGPELWHAVWVGAVLAVAAILVRLLWMWVMCKSNQRRGRLSVAPLRAQEVLVMTWSGMRGLVTLALVLSIPAYASTALHHEAAVIALVFLLITMVIPGLTLPALMRHLDLTENSEQVDRLHTRARKAAQNKVMQARDTVPEQTSEAVKNWLKVRFEHFDDQAHWSPEKVAQFRAKSHELRIESLEAAQQEMIVARQEPGVDPHAADEVLRELDELLLAAQRTSGKTPIPKATLEPGDGRPEAEDSAHT